MENFNGFMSLLWASIELLLLVNVLIFAEKNRINKIGFVLIGLLFSYQFTETMICAFDFNSSFTILIGYIIISYLPPVGLLLVMEYFKLTKKYNFIMFLPFIVINIYYIFNYQSFSLVGCTPFIAGYKNELSNIYGFFYYAEIAVILFILKDNYFKIPIEKKKEFYSLAIGFYIFVLPFFVMLPFIQDYSSYFESILCKFAITLAIPLSFFLLIHKEKNGKNS